MNITRIKNIREDSDLKQIDLANILNVKRSTYSLWELGINQIPLSYLNELSNYFNVSIDYLLRLSDDKDKIFQTYDIDFEIIGKNLKNIRIKNELSQENIADILNVSQASVYKYERGLSQIPITSLYIFANYFNSSLDKLLVENLELEEETNR